jgi:Sap, sulfolipid-1-addressing protein
VEIARIVILALGAAFYPTLLAVVLFMLTRPNPVRLLSAFLVGAALISVSIGLVILFVVESSGAITANNHSISPVIDLVAGALSLLIAFLVATERDVPIRERRQARKEAKRGDAGPGDPWTERMLARGSTRLAFALGIVLDLPSVWYLAALNQIAKSDYSTAVEVVLVLGFNVVMFSLLEIPLVLYLVAPERAEAIVARLNDSLRGHSRQIAVAVALTVGAYLVANGIAGLLS